MLRGSKGVPLISRLFDQVEGGKTRMHIPSILLVDDDPAFLHTFPRRLAWHLQGVNVETTQSTIDALQRLRKQDYDVVISGLTLPGMDGLELLAHVRQSRPETLIILITDQVDSRFLLEAMKQGAYDVLQKPINQVSLVLALHRAMQTCQLQRQISKQQNLLIASAQVLKRLGAYDRAGTPRSGSPETSRMPASPFQPPAWLL